MKPVCLPEQLLCSGVQRSPRDDHLGRRLLVHRAVRPQARSATEQPMRSCQAATRVVCIGSPECEAQASASSSSDHAERLRRAGLDQRYGLHRLQRRSRKDRPLHVAGVQPQRALRVGHGKRAAVDAFDQRPPA